MIDSTQMLCLSLPQKRSGGTGGGGGGGGGGDKNQHFPRLQRKPRMMNTPPPPPPISIDCSPVHGTGIGAGFSGKSAVNRAVLTNRRSPEQ